MNPFADPHVIFVLVSLAWFSLTDLYNRTTPGIEIFFGGAVVLGMFDNPLRVGVVLLMVVGVIGNWPPLFKLLLLFHPSCWMILLIGKYYREGIVGGADWLALAEIACLFAWYVPVAVWIGVLLWQTWWRKRWRGSAPVLPGMFLGLLMYIVSGLGVSLQIR